MSQVQPPLLPAVRRRRSNRVVLALLVVVFGIPLAVFLAWRLSLASDIRALEQKIRDAGEPLTLAELAATLPPVPDEENVFTALMDLWEEEDPVFWRAFRAGERPLPKHTRPVFDLDLPVLGRGQPQDSHWLPWTEAQMRAARAFVETNEVRAERVRAALSRPQARFPLDVEEGWHTLVPHWSLVREESYRLRIKGLLAIHDGQVGAVLDNFEQLLQLGEAMRSEPYVISQMLRVACMRHFLNGLEMLLSWGDSGQHGLEHLHASLLGIALDDAFYRALLGERARGLDIFMLPLRDWKRHTPGEESTDVSQNNFSLTTSPLNRILGLFSLDQRLLLDTYDRLAQLVGNDESWEGHLKTAEVIQQTLVEARRFPPQFVTGFTVLMSEKTGPLIVVAEARRRCALAALAVERFRRAHDGTLPASLEALPGYAPEGLWLDPFDNQPLRYRITPEGYRIYSIGPDRTDRGGLRRADSEDREAYDVVFAVERPSGPPAE